MHKWVLCVSLLCCYIVLSQDTKQEQTHFLFSEEKDKYDCTCNTIKNCCDYRCCCDNDCDDNVIKNWTDNGLCVNKKYKRYSDLKCKGKDKTKDYNIKEAGMIFYDQIKHLLCVKMDRTKIESEFYIYKANDKNFDDLFKTWTKNFWKEDSSSDNNNTQQSQTDTIAFYSTKDPMWSETQNYFGFELTENNFQFNINKDIEIKETQTQQQQDNNNSTSNNSNTLKMMKYGMKSNHTNEISLNTTLDTSKNWYLLILTAKLGLKTNPLSYIVDATLREEQKQSSEKALLKIRFKDVTEYD